jgi:hypothetical protein
MPFEIKRRKRQSSHCLFDVELPFIASPNHPITVPLRHQPIQIVLGRNAGIRP